MTYAPFSSGGKDEFSLAGATLAMSNDLKDAAIYGAEKTGGDPIAALLGAAMKVIKETMGDEHVVPLMQRMMTTICSSGTGTTSYN